MRVGVMLSQSLVSLDHVPLQALADAGVWAVLLRCFEDEIRWRAPAAEAFARAAADAGLRVFLVPAGYGGVFCPEQHPTSLLTASAAPGSLFPSPFHGRFRHPRRSIRN